MRIGMVLEATFPPDIRVSKEAKSLIKDTHAVIVLCPAKKKKDEGVYSIDGATVVRFCRSTLAHKLNKLLFGLFFIDFGWRRIVDRFVADHMIDVLHVHDLPLVKTCLEVARKRRIPIVADLHENYPAAIQQYLHAKSLLNWIRRASIDAYSRWSRYEKRIMRHVDRAIVVVPEALLRFKKAKMETETFHVVSNLVDLDNIPKNTLATDIVKKLHDRFGILYTGYLNYHRGIEVLLLSLKYLVGKIENPCAVIVGKGEHAYEESLRKLVAEHGLGDYVLFEGWQRFDRIFSYIEASMVCTVPHRKSEHTDTTIPHKLFQYMAMRKPVVVSDCNPLKRVVGTSGAGLVYPSWDPQSLAAMICRLHDDPQEAHLMGKRAFEAVQSELNWSTSTRELSNLYSGLERSVSQ